MPLQRWEPTLHANTVVEALRDLKGKLGRTPVYGASRLVTASTTIVDSDELLLVATAGGAVTVSLPDASTVLGRRFTIKKMDAHANLVTLDGFSTQTIDGAATLAWNTQYLAYSIQAVMTASPATCNWVIV